MIRFLRPQPAVFEDDPNPNPNPPKDDPPKDGPTKTFTQDDLNRIMADEKRKARSQQESMLKELEALRTQANLKAEEREEWDKKIEELQTKLMTKEELAAKEKKKLEEDYQKQLEEQTKNREMWESRYRNESITRSITDQAVVNDAWNPEQLVAILQPKARLEEVVEDEEPTGQFQTRIRFPDVDKDGKSVTLDLSVAEAVKRMTELEQYANLFKNKGAGGYGGSTGRTNKPDLKQLAIAGNIEEYTKQRKAGAKL